MKLHIDIETKTFVRFWLVIIGFVLLGVFIMSASSALVLVGIALFLAVALSKPVNWLAHRMPGKSRLGATALAFLIMVVFIVGVFALVMPPLIEQTIKLLNGFPELIENAKQQWALFGDFINRYNLQPQIDQAIKSIQSNLTSWVTGIGAGFVSGVGSIITFFVNAFLVIVMTFLMLLEGNSWMNGIWGLYRNKARMERDRRILYRMYDVTTSYVNGQIAVSGVGAFFAGLATAVISLIFGSPLDLAFPVAAITFVLTMVPMFGATLAGIVSCSLIALNVPLAGLVYVIYFVIYQQIENNFVSPVVQAKTMSLSPLAILLAVTIGTFAIGFAGAIISIPIAGSINVLIEEYRNGTLIVPEQSKGKKTPAVLTNLFGKSKKKKPADA